MQAIIIYIGKCTVEPQPWQTGRILAAAEVGVIDKMAKKVAVHKFGGSESISGCVNLLERRFKSYLSC